MSYFWNQGQFAGQWTNHNNNVSNESNRSHKSNDNQNCQKNLRFLESLICKEVKINRGGHDSIEGELLAVKSDYLVVCTDKGVVYVALSHVKSITEVRNNDENKSGNNNNNKSGNNKNNDNNKSGNKSRRRCRNFIKANTFHDVICQLNQQFVQLNTGGHEKMEGFISQVGKNAILFVADKEAIQIQIFHIKSVRPLNTNKNRSCGNKSNNRSDSRTQGNRSSNKSSRKCACSSALKSGKVTIRRSIKKG